YRLHSHNNTLIAHTENYDRQGFGLRTVRVVYETSGRGQSTGEEILTDALAGHVAPLERHQLPISIVDREDDAVRKADRLRLAVLVQIVVAAEPLAKIEVLCQAGRDAAAFEIYAHRAVRQREGHVHRELERTLERRNDHA